MVERRSKHGPPALRRVVAGSGNRSDDDIYGTNYTNGRKDQVRSENYELKFIDKSDVSGFGSVITEPLI